MKNEDTDGLEDGQDQYFDGATLQIGTEVGKPKYSNVDLNKLSFNGEDPKVYEKLVNGKTKDETESTNDLGESPSKSVVRWSGECARDYFSSRTELLDAALAECCAQLINQPHEHLLASYLLTEISLWDREKERLVLLTDSSLLIVKYDLIAVKILDHRRISLDQVDTVTIGNLAYPPASLIRSRELSGLRLQWGAPLSLLDKWNPFAREPPILTLVSHPLFWFTSEGGRERLSVEELSGRLSQTLDKRIKSFSCQVQRRPILVENYLNIPSLIHNTNSLGFFKVRGKFSF